MAAGRTGRLRRQDGSVAPDGDCSTGRAPEQSLRVPSSPRGSGNHANTRIVSARGDTVVTDEGPFCPACGEPVSATAEYCMHCYVDFTDDNEPVATPPDSGGVTDAGDTATDSTESGDGYEQWKTGGEQGSVGSGASDPFEGYDEWKGEGDATQLLDPDGLLDNTLTVIVGIVAGLVVGLISVIMLALLTENGWGFLLGIVVWLVTTAHLVRRRTVQGAIAHGGYALAVVLLAIPFVAAAMSGPSISDRLGALFAALMFVSIPAAISGVVGLVASQFVPEQDGEG